jgi:hypothetical protein
MARHYKALGFVFVVMLGLYGCAKGPGGSAGTEAASAARVQRLEEDYRAAVAARDQFRQKLVSAEEQQAKTKRELEQAKAAAAAVAAEREALKGEVKARTGERDALNAQFETFRKNLKELIGTADSAVGALNLPPPQVIVEPLARK